MMKNILVGVDFHDHTDKLLLVAQQIAKAFNAKLWLVHAAAPEPDFVGFEVGPQYIRDTRAEELREERRKLQGFVSSLEENGVEADGLLIPGATVKVILDEAQKLETDLIIAGHEDHGILHHAFFGSVSMEILKASDKPVLIVPFND